MNAVEQAQLQEYADEQQRAATHWRQEHQRIAEALGFTGIVGVEDVLLRIRRLVSTPEPAKTLRDEFAMAALTAVAATIEPNELLSPEARAIWPRMVAQRAYRLADMLLERRQ